MDERKIELEVLFRALQIDAAAYLTNDMVSVDWQAYKPFWEAVRAYKKALKPANDNDKP